MDKKVRFHVFVSGRVQGVFFRENTRRLAEELGIMGWVRNLPDGLVEAVLEGEKEKIDQLTEWVRQGPTFAKVDNLETIVEQYQGEFKNFEIKYN